MLMKDQVDWGQDRKVQFRHDAIITTYRKLFDYSLPPDQQFWSMCGQCVYKGRRENCEPDQMIKCGLITKEQYRGVEINKEIHELNEFAWPNLKWCNNDFYREMNAAYVKKEFTPGIVNADLTQTWTTGVPYIGKIMALLTRTEQKLLFAANFVLRARNHPAKEGSFVLGKLEKEPTFSHAAESGKWELVSDYYAYQGTNSHGRTWMGCLLFALNK